MRIGTHRSDRRSRRGAATLAVIFAVMLLLAMSGAILSVTLGSKKERSASVDRMLAHYAASSGVSHAMANLMTGVADDIGSEEAMVDFSAGSYWVDVVEDDGAYVVTSRGYVSGEGRGIEAVLIPQGQGIYDNAIFAGNSSDDPLYSLPLGGKDKQADEINGDIYSGGGVTVTGDASVSGKVEASGVISGASGKSNASQPIPDIAGMDYENTADVMVKDIFDKGATYTSNGLGGKAWQVDEKSLAHFFRMNPSDRSTETSSTDKDDYFLEDPYEAIGVDKNQDGTNATPLSLPYKADANSNVNGKVGSEKTNGSVYFIDGNLWLHNKKTYSFQMKSYDESGTQITFVVKGNIYFSDNFFYEDATVDGVAFIAIEDPDVEDSGNIYLGDPEFGTLHQMQAFMYAENNFYDINLDASGSATVELYGNMTAGDQVLIDRDFGDSHTKLTVDFDSRISDGTLELPGLPVQTGDDLEYYTVASWRMVPAN